jgi:magnesium-transporting ATPase (P-type)
LFIFNTIFIFLSLNNKNALYLIPLISLFGSVLLSFHAYFLIFSRHYSEFIEKRINSEYDENILIAHELENDYFFPTQERKIVVAVLNKGFTWFSFVTLFITLYGISSYIWAMSQILNNDLNMMYIYLVSTVTFITLVIGYWWFVSGTGEKRLEKVFNKHG